MWHSWAAKLCQKVNRNFTQEEWRRFFGEREYEKTGPGGGVGGEVVRIRIYRILEFAEWVGGVYSIHFFILKILILTV